VAFLRREIGDPWPDWSDATLVASASEWLEPYLAGMTSMSEVSSLDVSMLLRSQLPWPEGARLDELAPTRLELASGRSIVIDYTSGVAEGTAPVVPIRVQDLFGTKEHPSIAGGRVKLVLQLLSPADRPIQITSDLPGFWSGSWTEVRKDMAGRYPKHQWPEDPANADPKRLK
jgi:ATP-dependent helicase HrpB